MTIASGPSQGPRIARGGKAIYGAPLGILMLEARFPRLLGDMGNGGTWPFPVLYRVVGGASPDRVVLKGAAGLLPDFVAAAQDLVRLGAEAITTNCGFLSLFQRELAAAVVHGAPLAQHEQLVEERKGLGRGLEQRHDGCSLDEARDAGDAQAPQDKPLRFR
ncbi:MAG: hypothetical protein ACOVOI_14260, partial [Hyphomicrobiales bacterium]